MTTFKKHPLIVGTLVLTATGFISRIIGFYYRIYLTRLFGEEGMGIYQLLSPVLALSFSVTAAGYQTAISKFVAERTAKGHHSLIQPLLAGLSISLPLSLLCNVIIYQFADFIGCHLLQESRTVSMLRILSFSIPLSSVHSCINGYFYGRKKTVVPAVAQLVEQLGRVLCVFLIASYAFQKGNVPTINVAVLGLTVGEFLSLLVSVVAVYISNLRSSRAILPTVPLPALPVYKGILSMAMPLTANRVVLNLLQSVETISIPAKLKLFGYDTATALSVYGVLTGMAMPLIFFPNALTGSVAVLLLPIISENNALGNKEAVKKAVMRTIKYCGGLGLLCTGLFGLTGRLIGMFLFDSALAGHFITTLGFICPFLYLDTTLSSILQGLGKAGSIFIMNILSLLIRLLFIYTTVPSFGITGYLWGLLASQLIQCLLYLSCLYRHMKKGK